MVAIPQAIALHRVGYCQSVLMLIRCHNVHRQTLLMHVLQLLKQVWTEQPCNTVLAFATT